MSEQNGISRRRFLQGALAGGVAAAFPHFNAAYAADNAGAAIARNAMAEGRPSATAYGAAVLRAAHQILDEPRILEDPLALRIIGAKGESAIRSDPQRFEARRTLRASVALRSRFAEDQMAEAVENGITQYVILGAGLDTFAYRNPYPWSRLHVFEVDHPATQNWKRERLSEAQIAIPSSLTFAPVDFETQTLGEGLSQVGFNVDEPAFFSLLGVVIYLTRPAAMSTLEFVASSCPGSEIVFEYSIPSFALTENERRAREAAAAQVARIGEPWITYFDPPTLANDLMQLGFSRVEDLGAAEANARYFKDRSDGLRIGGSWHVVKASV